MDLNYKGCLQEYCQKRCLKLPEYHRVQEDGADHEKIFQIKVVVDDENYVGDPCSRIKAAEQSAAQVAWNALNTYRSPVRRPRSIQSSTFVLFPQMTIKMKHLPIEYARIEEFIISLIEESGGRIRKVRPADEHGFFQIGITGTYRYCANVHRHHRKNHIYFVVQPVRSIYYQGCHDIACAKYRSPEKPIPLPVNSVLRRSHASVGSDLPATKWFRTVT